MAEALQLTGNCSVAVQVRHRLHLLARTGPVCQTDAQACDTSAYSRVNISGRRQAAGYLGDLGRGRPDVTQVYRLTVIAGPQRVAGQVSFHRPGERVGDH